MKDVTKAEVANSKSFIRLSLRKPREWKVALTTSVSSPAIIPPDIQLWDAKRGTVLVDTSRPKGRGGEYMRSKSASFTNMGVEGTIKAKKVQNRQLWESNNPVPVAGRNNMLMQKEGKQIRPKALSSREGENRLVSPGDCVRPRTPVMTARRILLTRNSSTQTLPTERSYSTDGATQINGITTHHRKQHSDSRVYNSRRKVKNNVSFGRVDTIDDTSGISSSFSLMRSKGTSNLISTDSERSTPKITITEIVGKDDSCKSFNIRNKSDRAKQRSHSGIPVLVKAHSDSISGYSVENSPTSYKKVEPDNSNRNGSGRKSRRDLFMQQDTDRQRFSLVRTPEPPPLLPPSAFLYSQTDCQCNRGSCPLAKYFQVNLENVPLVSTPERNNSYKEKISKRTNIRDQPISINCKGDVQQSVHDQLIDKCRRNRSRKKRVPSRSRQEMMSSSSSECENWTNTRLPPWRKRRTQNTKGKSLNILKHVQNVV